MILTKKEFRQLIEANGLKIRYINNHITTREEYVDNPDYDPNYVLGETGWDFRKSRKINAIKVPVTSSWRYSEWWICVPVRHRGIEVYMWFRAMFWKNNTLLQFSLDHIWNGGSGKKLRRDARWNICEKLEKKARLGYWAKPEADIIYLPDSRTYVIKSSDKGYWERSKAGEKGAERLAEFRAVEGAREYMYSQGYRIGKLDI